MTESKREPNAAWDDVSRGFQDLGRALRPHFAGRPDDADDAGDAREQPRPEDPASSDDRAKVEDALRRLGQAVQRLGDQASSAVRDPAVRESAERVSRSFGDALAATFSGFGDEVRGRVGDRRGSSEWPSDPPGGPPPKTAPPPIEGHQPDEPDGESRPG
jgi:hypothetical protein